jgi:hypothetical protein
MIDTALRLCQPVQSWSFASISDVGWSLRRAGAGGVHFSIDMQPLTGLFSVTALFTIGSHVISVLPNLQFGRTKPASDLNAL